MTKKQIFWIIIAAIVIVSVLCLHFFPLWVSGVTVVSFGAGCIAGWAIKTFYNKYIKPINNGEEDVEG